MKKVVRGAREMGIEPATPDEAREMIDLKGLDTIRHGMQQLYGVFNNATEPFPLIGEKVSRGGIGVKSGKGWHSYEGKTRAEVLRERDRKLLGQLVLYQQG